MTNGMDTHTPTVLSICTGAGGLDLGFNLALPSSRTVCYVERDAFAAVHLVKAMEAQYLDDAPVWDDLRTFDGAEWRGLVDCVIGGIPCQPHSIAGRRRGASDERDLWDDTARVIDEVRPRLVFLENVANIMGYYHERIGGELQAMGYETEEGLFSAEEVGASHVRQRFFILGYTDRGHVNILGDAQREGLHGHDHAGRQGGRAEGAISASDDVADSGGDQSRDVLLRTRRPRQADADAGRTNSELGNSATVSPDGLAGQGQAGGAALSVAGCELPDAYGKGWEVLGRTGQAESPFELQALFPPRPDDYDGWAYMLGEMPSLEPALCRMADGFTQQMDRTARLSLIGNSVVPLVAAVALRTLAHTATQGD